MYKVVVKEYMTQKSTPDFDFMAKWNANVPMPRTVMFGDILNETKGMYFMALEADDVHWSGWVIKSSLLELTELDNINNVSKSPKTNASDVHIRIADSKKAFSEQSLYVSFDYDESIIEIIRNLPERYYNKSTKEWEIPAKELDALKSAFTNYHVTVEGKIRKITKTPKVVASVPDGFEFKTEPFAHQVEGFNYGLSHKAWLLGDEQGLGKTKQVIDIAIAKKIEKGYKHCLIVCGVNGLKWNWVREIETHSYEGGYILGQREFRAKLTIGSNADKLTDVKNLDKIDSYFIITNIESLRSEDIAKELAARCKSGDIGLVAIDEIHKCKNPSSQQSKGLLKIDADYKIAMTGTPLMNTPLDIFIILKWLGYEKHAFYAFKNHYCNMGGFGGYQVVSYKNLEELQKQLNEVMLRRLKSEVLDLPDKLYVDEFVEMTPKQEQVYKEVSADVQLNIDKIKASNNPLAELIRLRQATGYTGILSNIVTESAKLDRMEELVKEATDNGKKCVIFSNWTQITGPAAERLKQYKPIVLTGETKDADRQFLVQQFQEMDSVKVAIGTTGAMGTGITLTAGTVVIFLDEPWTNAAKEQAIDRCHRIGTTDNITIYTIMAHNTIDERIHSIVLQKGEIADFMVDNKVIDNRALVDFLLS